MKKTFLFIAIAAIVLTGCSSTKAFSYGEHRTAEPTYSISAVPVVADLVVSPTRETYTETIRISGELTPADFKTFVESQKNVVLSNALLKFKADMMVLPLFQVTERELVGIISITISGYPASYSGFRSATKEDEWFVTPNATPSVAPAPAPAETSKFKLF